MILQKGSFWLSSFQVQAWNMASLKAQGMLWLLVVYGPHFKQQVFREHIFPQHYWALPQPRCVSLVDVVISCGKARSSWDVGCFCTKTKHTAVTGSLRLTVEEAHLFSKKNPTNCGGSLDLWSFSATQSGTAVPPSTKVSRHPWDLGERVKKKHAWLLLIPFIWWGTGPIAFPDVQETGSSSVTAQLPPSTASHSTRQAQLAQLSQLW